MSRTLRALFHRRLRSRAGRLAERLAPHLPTGRHRLLDVGSGTGHNAEALRRRPGAICLEADVVDFHVVGPGPLMFDGARLPLADDAVEICLLIHVLNYAEDPAALLREASRVASRGILLVQSTYRGPTSRAALRARSTLQGRIAFRICRTLGLIPRAADPLRRRREFTREQLAAIVAESGLTPRVLEPEHALAWLPSRDLFVLERHRTP